MSTPHFRAAEGEGQGWAEAAKACADALMPVPEGASLGFLYVTSEIGEHLGSVLTFLRERTRVPHWVGTIGLGVCGSAEEHFERAAVSALVVSLPESAFRVFGPEIAGGRALQASARDWFAATTPVLGIVHGDPRDTRTTETLAALSGEAGLFLVGGIAAAQGAPPRQIADRVVEGGLSGVVLAPDVAVVTALSQGCSPIGPIRQISEANENIVMAIDDRPALEVFKEDIGELLSRDLRRVAGRIFAGMPVRGSDTGDYLVRNLMAIDTERQWLAVAEKVSPGDPILFCRRDPATAREDLQRMLDGLKRRAGGVPKAGLYFSCVARGPSLFGAGSQELQAIRGTLGDFPLAGFFGNGEIAHDRLYGYTGVLALFL
ncbi:MAG TPA: FIST C-terminal domain-containing protein [Stellaceae bacterium]|nr:FIST C-terminal domain-containing protein [Stellaceae bacterium]